MKKIEIEAKDVISLIISIIIGAILIGGGLLFVGNKPEVYSDIIMQILARDNGNISGELNIFWCVLFLGIPVLLFINSLLNNKNLFHENKTCSYFLGIQIVINIGNIIYYLIKGQFNAFLTFGTIVLYINHLILPNKEKEGILTPIIIYYFLLTLCAIANFVGISTTLNSSILLIFTLIIDVLLFLIDKRKSILSKSLLVMQCIIPFLFILYQCRRYIYNGQTIYLEQPIAATIFFSILILSMFFYSIIKLIKYWKNSDSLPISKIILITTCLVVFTVNSISISTSKVLPVDLHHPAENIISYQQIFEKNQKPYTDYFPVSGLFPTFIGFIQEILGGKMTNHYLSHSIFLIIFSLLIMYFFCKYLDNDACLLASLLFVQTSYNRMVFILLSLLILFLPKLMHNKNLWLKVWLWLCFIGGIYYPTYGMAVLVGTLPVCIMQLITYIKSDEFKLQRKTFKFYFLWLICLLPILFSVPLLINMMKHILIYASQSKLSDGIAMFGQNVPNGIINYLSDHVFIRTILYYALHYIIPIAFVWIIILLLKNIKRNFKGKTILKNKQFLMLMAALLILIVSYSSVMIRNDVDKLLTRPAEILVMVGGLFLYLIIVKFAKKNFSYFIIIGCIFGIFLSLGYSGINNISSRFQYAYNIDSSYEMISSDMENKYPRMGSGLVSKNTLAILEQSSRVYDLLKYDSNLKFFALGDLGVYYILNLTTMGQPSTSPITSYEATKEIIDAINTQKPVIGTSFSANVHHYFYTWILTNDDYIYDEQYKLFLPKELFYKIYGKDAKPGDKRNLSLYLSNIGKISNSLGKSLYSLKERLKNNDVKSNISLKKFENKETDYEVHLEKEVYGVDANYLYVKFDLKDELDNYYNSLSLKQKLLKQNGFDNATVEVRWGGGSKDSIISILGNGELLIPLTANVSWLLNYHQDFTITIKNMNNEVKIEELKFFKVDMN